MLRYVGSSLSFVPPKYPQWDPNLENYPIQETLNPKPYRIPVTEKTYLFRAPYYGFYI